MHISRKYFCLPRNWYFLFQNYFSNYVYLKDICKTLKEIGKIQFVPKLAILLNLYISKFYVTLHKEKNWNYQSLNTILHVGKLTSVKYILLILLFTVFEEECLAQMFWNLSGKVAVAVTNSDN